MFALPCCTVLPCFPSTLGSSLISYFSHGGTFLAGLLISIIIFLLRFDCSVCIAWLTALFQFSLWGKYPVVLFIFLLSLFMCLAFHVYMFFTCLICTIMVVYLLFYFSRYRVALLYFSTFICSTLLLFDEYPFSTFLLFALWYMSNCTCYFY